MVEFLLERPFGIGEQPGSEGAEGTKEMTDRFCMIKREEFVLPLRGRRSPVDVDRKLGHQVKEGGWQTGNSLGKVSASIFPSLSQ